MQGDVTPRAALPIAAPTGKPRCESDPTHGRLRLAPHSAVRRSVRHLARRSCQRRRAAHRAARRDAVVDRGGQQPHHPHRRRLQRPVRELAGRARRTIRCRRTVEGYAALQKAGLVAAAPAAASAAAAAAAPPRPPPRPPPLGGYTVRAGRHALRPRRRRARVRSTRSPPMNGLDPTGAAARRHRDQAARPARPRPPRAVAARAGRDASSRRPRPSRPPTRVGAADVQSVAAAARRLPLARRPRSPGRRAASTTRWSPRANARGVMQVMPGTWDYVQQNLAGAPAQPELGDRQRHRRRALPQAACSTRPAATSRAAIAAYYQGLGAVRSRGVFDDTQQYVANVQALRSRFGG